MKQKVILNWSGGKDAALALYKLQEEGIYDIQCLLTAVSSAYQRVSMHGLRLELLETQARHTGLPLVKMMVPPVPTMENYEQVTRETLTSLKKEGASFSAYGDIFLEDLRTYRDNQLRRMDLEGLFPLWKKPTAGLVREFIDLGFKAIIVCVDEKCLDKSFAGRPIDKELLDDLPAAVDPCGENGEFHSFVFDGPLFSSPVPFTKGEIVYRRYTEENASSTIDSGLWYCDLLPA